MSFPADATLVVSLVGAASLFAIAQVAEQDKSAEEEVRRLNTQEVQAFLVPGMVESGFLAITSYDRQIEYARVYGDTVIVAGHMGRSDAERRKDRASPFHGSVDETAGRVATGRPPRQHRASAIAWPSPFDAPT